MMACLKKTTGALALAASMAAAGGASAQTVAPDNASAAPAPVQQNAPATPTAPATPAAPDAPAVPAVPSAQPAPENNLPFSDPTGVLAPVYEGLSGAARMGLEPPSSFPVHMTTIIDHAVGTGGFMLNQYAKQPYFASTVRLQPSLAITNKLRAQMILSATKEWLASATQNTAVPNQAIVQDTWMGLAVPNIYKEPITGIGFGGGAWVFAPTSLQSRADTLVVGGRPYGTVSWSKWNFMAQYTVSFRKNLHQYINPTVDSRDGAAMECTNTGGRCFVTEVKGGPPPREGEEQLVPAGGGRVLDLRRRNVSHQLLNFVTVGYTLLDSISLSATGVLINNWRYPVQRDGFTSEFSNNVWGHTDFTWLNFDATYMMFDKVAFSAGLFSFQPFFVQHRGTGIPGITQDGRSGPVQEGNLLPAIPFVDVITTPGNNYSTAYFDVVISL